MTARGRSPLVVLAAAAAFVAALLLAPRAEAYSWMLRHEYTSCSSCHADPSGGGLLSLYGRAQSEILLRMQYGRDPEADPGTVGDFAFGVVTLPKQVLLGATSRSLLLRTIAPGAPALNRVIVMQADALAQVTIDRVRANGSLGYVHEGAFGASLTTGPNDRLISRVHWVGVDLGSENQVLLRAGRMNLPFGIRSIEHTAWVRSETRTDINAAQQYGVAASYNAEKVRAELMFIAGNFQLSPARYRSLGYAAYAEYAFSSHLAVGASSMITHSPRDLLLLSPAWRHAHGVFARFSPSRWLVLSGETDLLHVSQPTPGTTAVGMVSLLSADFEPIQGLHLVPAFELRNRAFAREGTSLGGWLSALWFFAPHADMRVDGIVQSIATPAGPRRATSLLAQFHVWL